MIGGHTTIEIFEPIRIEMCKLSNKRLLMVHKNLKAVWAYPPSIYLHLLFANIDDGVEFIFCKHQRCKHFKQK